MRSSILLIPLIAYVQLSASPYPIEPHPLRMLVIESPYIITGRVIGIKVDKRKNSGYHYARIKISEVLQGAIGDEVIEVSYNPQAICPAPPHYEAGTDVIVFLKKERGSYYTYALSYGVKTLSLPEIYIYKQRIVEMQQILKIENADKKFMETIEWLVKCAEHPVTRWEGTFELSPESDFMSFYSRSEKHPYQYMLSKQQKDRLKAALFANQEATYSDLGLVDVVFPEHPEEVHVYLLKTLKQMKPEQLWYADEYMRRVLYTINGPALDRLIEQFSEKRFDHAKRDELRSIVNEFVALVEAEEGKPPFKE
ncbi:MAG TPA: hypothetical protein VEB86_03280 [Chryseosolibacter sp.]|nr:hypothetical protein [Chryseosolibacter sp.]